MSKLTLSEMTRTFTSALSGEVGDGFNYVKPDTLVKSADDKTFQILVQLTGRHETARVAFYTSLRLERIEEVYARFYPFKNDQSRSENKTISWNSVNLLTDGDYNGAFKKSSNSIPGMLEMFLPAIKSTLIPHLDHYSDVENLVASFEQPDYRKWATSDPVKRYCIMLSAYVLASDKTQFDATVEDCFAFCGKTWGAHHKPVLEAVIAGLKDHPNFSANSLMAS